MEITSKSQGNKLCVNIQMQHIVNLDLSVIGIFTCGTHFNIQSEGSIYTLDIEEG